MLDQDSKGISYTAGFFMLIAFMIAGAAASAVIAIPVWKGLTGTEFTEYTTGYKIAKYATAYKIIHGLNFIFSFFIPTLVTASFLNRRPFHLLGFYKRSTLPATGISVLLILIAMLVSGGLSWFNQEIPFPETWKTFFEKLENDYSQQVETIIGSNSIPDLLIALILMALLPAICEETLFRGGLQNFLTIGTKKPWLSIIIVSIIFSALHFSVYGFLARLFLSIVLGALFYYSRNLWLCILAHFINNAIALVMLYSIRTEGKTISDLMKETNNSWWGIFALPLLIGLFILFKKVTTGKPQQVSI